MTISAEQVAAAVEAAIPALASRVPRDVYDGFVRARAIETHPRGKAVLDHLIANAAVAAGDSVPICQDTGTVWVSLEVGPDVAVCGDVLAQIDASVGRAYIDARLRKSLVRNALFDRSNTQDNTPAFTEIHPVDEPGAARLSIMLKGGGSDNASRVVMLTPGAGRQGIVDEVVRCVREKAANACPPLVVGIGVGATFDKVAGLAKRALMRPVGMPSRDADAAEFEHELLEKLNETGLGPGGIGGIAVALDVHVETAPCHIAALPLAINMGCSALRRAVIDLASDVPIDAQLDRQLVNASDVSISSSQEASNQAVQVSLPLSDEARESLHAGDACLLTGPLYALRDAGHIRLLAETEAAGNVLPYGLEGQAIFYAGPTPEAAGRPFGAVGPTTSSRMDFATPQLLDAGVRATIGKGRRSKDVREACARTKSVYFTATGGAAALLAKCVDASEVVAYDDLGTEALRRIHVKDFPVFVAIDSTGTDMFDEV